jgi:hypothetical protein
MVTYEELVFMGNSRPHALRVIVGWSDARCVRPILGIVDTNINEFQWESTFLSQEFFDGKHIIDRWLISVGGMDDVMSGVCCVVSEKGVVDITAGESHVRCCTDLTT